MASKHSSNLPALPSGTVTILFTDIEGSTRLWEQEPERMSPALARHDALVRAAVESNRGMVVKMVGDGLHAAFDDPLDALNAALAMQEALADVGATNGVALRVRCGLHAGPVERRDNDFFGNSVNRAARIMSAAHGGQVLLSQVVVDLVTDRLPSPASVRDLGSVRLRDLASAEHVYQLVHPQLCQAFPALRSLETTPNNLSQQVTSFIGRERELAEVKQLLGNTRLLNLLGAGGIGKTRLSLQAAADVIDDYPDGVWFIELAPIADEKLVPQAVATVLGVKEEVGHPVVEALVKYVKDLRLMLILDNCEHLTHACAELAKQLLQSGPRLKILASSREHLHVAGETSYAVPPLSVPDGHKTITRAALTQYEAVRLFIERAVAGQRAFKVTDDNATAVADICRRLDGIPLAIELAAARVRALSVEQIAARLNDRFRLLTRGDQTALPRHQTLRASIDWSYDLLSETERMLLRRLAVFAGGWTLEAAEAVGADGDVDKLDVLDLLTNLVEKSLVTLEAEGERYRLLETVRQYAQERLDESADGDQTRTRHLAFYLALAENASSELVGPEQGARLARLDLERENILSTHAWCGRAKGGAELGLRLVKALSNFWPHRDLLEIGYRTTVEALTRAGAQESSPVRCMALAAAGQLAVFMGLQREARGYGEESLSIAREIGDKGKVALALQVLGMACNELGDRATALGHFEESLALAREVGPQSRLAAALHNFALRHRLEGNLDKAEPLYVESLALARKQGDRSGNTAMTLCSLAAMAIERGSDERAWGMLLEAIEIAEEIGSKWAGRQALDGSANLAAFMGDWDRAARLYGTAAAQREQMGLHRDPGDEASLALVRQALGDAAFSAAEAAGRALSYEESMAETRAWLASAH